MTTLTAATPSMAGGLGGGGGSLRGPRAVAGHGPSAALSGGDILAIIRQRIVLIAAIWLLGTIAVATMTFFMIQKFPVYSATALIQVQSIAPANPLNPLARDPQNPQENDRNLMDQAMIVQSPDVLTAALKRADVQNTAWYREAQLRVKENNESDVDLLNDVISAVPIHDTTFIGVTAKTSMASEAATLVNTVVEEYLNKIRNKQKDDIRESSQELERELGRANKDLQAAQEQVDQFRASEEIGTSNAEADNRLSTLMSVATELDLELSSRKSLVETLQNTTPETMPITPDMQAAMENDAKLMGLDATVQQAEQGLYMLRQRYGAKHRAVKDAEEFYQTALRNLEEERAVKLLKTKTAMLDQAKRNYLEATDALATVREKLADAVAAQKDRDSKRASYTRMLEERDMLRGKVEQLQQQRDYVNMMLRAEKLLRINFASPAVAPKRRSSPLWQIWLPAGTVLSLMAGIGLALLLDLTDKTVRTPRDVTRHVAVPVLGTIPTSDDDEIEIERVETAALDAPHSVIAEAFRQLRANLFFSAPAEQQGVIMVTSPSAENGKTTVSVNLAISIALSGRRVLLIDANFRRPAIPRIFPKLGDQGLSNVLIGQCRLDDVATPTGVPGLDAVSPGPSPPNPAELLGSSYLRDLIVDARSRYDQVIFDGPPVLLVSDAAVLAGAVDGVLMVCRYRSTSRGALLRARAQLEAINSRVFGVVLNGVETRAGGYFRRHYREFYEYHEEDEAVPGSAPRLVASKGTQPAGVAPAAMPPLSNGGQAERLAPRRSPDIEPEPESESELDLTLGGVADVAEGSPQIEDQVGEIRIGENMGLGAASDGPPLGSASDAGEPVDLAREIDLDADLGLDRENMTASELFDFGLGDEFSDSEDENEPPGDENEPRA